MVVLVCTCLTFLSLLQLNKHRPHLHWACITAAEKYTLIDMLLKWSWCYLGGSTGKYQHSPLVREVLLVSLAIQCCERPLYLLSCAILLL